MIRTDGDYELVGPTACRIASSRIRAAVLEWAVKVAVESRCTVDEAHGADALGMPYRVV
jgi:hypothetical protein